MYIYTHICELQHNKHICVYIYIEREREIDVMLVHSVYIYMCIGITQGLNQLRDRVDAETKAGGACKCYAMLYYAMLCYTILHCNIMYYTTI